MSDGLNAWPAGLLTRVRKLEKIYKTTVKLQPVNQGSVTAGNKILLQFPMDSVFDLKSLSFDELALQGDARIARRPDIYSVRYTDGKVGQGQRAPQPRSARGRRGRSRPVGEEAPPQSPKVATFQPRAALLADPRCGPQPRALGRAARPRRLSMGGGHDGEATGPADSTNPGREGG